VISVLSMDVAFAETRVAMEEGLATDLPDP
jgi:hypothetical protein